MIKAPDWAARHLWEVQLKPGEAHDLGTVALRHGATLFGEVTTVDGPADPAVSRVWAVPVSAAEHDLRPSQLLEGQIGTRTELTEQGFFLFEDLKPGSYVVVVHQPGYALNDRNRVRVEENSETALRQPIVLTPPTRLEVLVEPPVDQRSQPWEIRLRRDDAVGVSGGVVAQGSTQEGRWVDRSLEAGTYRVTVEDSSGNRVAAAGPVHVETQQDLFLPIALGLVEVKGSVELGDEPLPRAEIWFGGRSGQRSVEAQSDEEGVYRTFFPEGGDWLVEVEADQPPVSYSGEVEVPSEGGKLDLSLPAVVLDDALGENVGRSLIMIEGEVLPVGLLARWAEMNGVDISADSRDLVIPALPSGVYRYCRVTRHELMRVLSGIAVARTCSEGVVAPGGQLTLARP